MKSRSVACRSMAPIRPALHRWEKRNIADFVPVWEAGPLRPVRTVQLRLPAQRDPRQIL